MQKCRKQNSLQNKIQYMKVIMLILIYIVSLFGLYCTLSAFALLLIDESYVNILHTSSWFLLYLILFGWWIPIFICREYYIKHEDYFDQIF